MKFACCLVLLLITPSLLNAQQLESSKSNFNSFFSQFRGQKLSMEMYGEGNSDSEKAKIVARVYSDGSASFHQEYYNLLGAKDGKALLKPEDEYLFQKDHKLLHARGFLGAGGDLVSTQVDGLVDWQQELGIEFGKCLLLGHLWNGKIQGDATKASFFEGFQSKLGNDSTLSLTNKSGAKIDCRFERDGVLASIELHYSELSKGADRFEFENDHASGKCLGWKRKSFDSNGNQIGKIICTDISSRSTMALRDDVPLHFQHLKIPNGHKVGVRDQSSFRFEYHNGDFKKADVQPHPRSEKRRT